jgi:hypothetical protein
MKHYITKSLCIGRSQATLALVQVRHSSLHSVTRVYQILGGPLLRDLLKHGGNARFELLRSQTDALYCTTQPAHYAIS